MHIDKDLQRHAVPVAMPSAFQGLDLGFAQGGVAKGLYQVWVKRVLDILAIVICLPLVLPFMGLLALATLTRRRRSTDSPESG